MPYASSVTGWTMRFWPSNAWQQPASAAARPGAVVLAVRQGGVVPVARLRSRNRSLSRQPARADAEGGSLAKRAHACARRPAGALGEDPRREDGESV